MNRHPQRRYVLLDRDGTLIVERHYLSDPTLVELLPGAGEGLLELSRLGLGFAVVTNQSGIGRGYFDAARLGAIHRRMTELLDAYGVVLDGIYVCPHTPEDNCTCRKPRSGLVEAAAAELGFEPAASFVIGDKPCDIGLGKAVGAHTFLVRTGYGERHEREGGVHPDYIVDNVLEAARIIARLVAAEPAPGTRRTRPVSSRTPFSR